MTEHRIAPEQLIYTSYKDIAARMLGGLHIVSNGTSPTAEYAVFDKSFPEIDEFTDCSFATQIGNTYADAAVLHGDATGPPDAYVVTANSAVPVADAIRGFYDALDVPTPPIFPIVYDRREVYSFLNGDDPVPDPRTPIVQDFSDRLSGANHVGIIDQYVCTNSTLQYTALVLKSAGVEHVTAMRGDWYYSANLYETGLDAVSAGSHTDFMHEIGVKSADLVFGTSEKQHG